MPARASRLTLPHHWVSAVLVAHDGGRWLPETLAALPLQTRPPQRAVAVDTGSRDETPDLLAQAVGPANVVTLPRETGFGAAAAAGVAALDAQRRRRGDQPLVEWVWLLHDDFAPEPGALAALLEAAEAHPRAAVLGPKVRDWDEPLHLVEVGVTIDRAGRRETRLERRELDQGQHDQLRQVLAVNTAGALVRRDVWDALGGLDTRLPMFRDDVDLGWRATAAGHEVLVVPQAVGRHARAAWTGRRPVHAAHGRATGIDRRHSIAVLLANLPPLVLAAALPRLVIGALLRALAFLLTRQLSAARDEVAALAWNVRHLGGTVAARRARRDTIAAGWPLVRQLLAGRTERMRSYLEAAGDWLTGGGGDSSLAGLGEEEDAGEPVVEARLGRVLRRHPGVVVLVALTLVALVAERALLGTGRLVGGEMFPPPTGAEDYWRAFGSSWLTAGGGAAGSPTPAFALLGGLAGLLLGKGWLAVDVLLLGSVPLSGYLAYRAAARYVEPVTLRLWAGFAYGLLPVATGAIAGGRLDTAVAWMLAPPLLAGGHRLAGTDPRYIGWRHAYGYGLLLAAATAFAPQTLLLATVVLTGAAVAGLLGSHASRRPGAVRRAIAVATAIGTAFVLLLPWSWRLLEQPRLLFAGVTRPATSVPDAVDLLLLRPGGPSAGWSYATVGLLLGALAALLRRERAKAALTAWVLAGTGWVVALLVARGAAGVPRGYPGPALALTAAALVGAAALAADGARDRLAARDFSWRQPLALAIAVAAGAGPLVIGAGWVAQGADGPLDRRAVRVLPAFVLAEATRDPGLRVVWLTGTGSSGTVRYAITTTAGLGLVDAGAEPDASTKRILDGLVRDLASLRGTNAAEGLSTFAVRYIAVPSPAPAGLAEALDAQAGLTRVAYLGAVQLWRTLAPSSRVVLLPPELSTVARAGAVPSRPQLRATPLVRLGSGREQAKVTLPAGPEGRLLVLAERADDGWAATTPDGAHLASARAYGWAQAFIVPAAGGEVTVRRDQSGRTRAITVEAVLLLVAVVLAAPSVRRPSDAAADDVEPVPADAAPDEPLVDATNVRTLT